MFSNPQESNDELVFQSFLWDGLTALLSLYGLQSAEGESAHCDKDTPYFLKAYALYTYNSILLMYVQGYCEYWEEIKAMNSTVKLW